MGLVVGSRRARRTVDLSGLSRVGRHESHHTRSAAEIVRTVPAGKLKSTLDCVDGYHGAELAKEDRHKTTFATEWGLFRYLRVPQGYLSSGDSYTKHTDAILDACPRQPAEHDYEKIIDDIIQWSDSLEESFFRICSILSHCNQNGSPSGTFQLPTILVRSVRGLASLIKWLIVLSRR